MSYEIKTLISESERSHVTDEFIEKNQLRLSRTQEEIAKKLEEGDGLFNFASEVLVDYLNFEDSKSLYNEKYVESVEKGEAEAPKQITDLREAVQDFLDYMVFAWGKAQNQRGISASRSINKLSTWAWLFGRFISSVKF